MKISFIGAGGLGHNLAPALAQHHQVLQIISRKQADADQLRFLVAGAKAGTLDTPLHPDTEVLILGVPDDAIPEVLQHYLAQIPEGTLVVHCAGTVHIQALSVYAGPKAVLYPLQTLSKQRRVSWEDVPIFIEGIDGGEALVAKLVDKLSGGAVRSLNSDDRKVVHLGAVLAANFVNALIAQSSRIVDEIDLPYDIYLPLAREVVAKLDQMPPLEAQTGPAIRGDAETLKAQKSLLRNTAPELIPLYELLTQVITRMRTSTIPSNLGNE